MAQEDAFPYTTFTRSDWRTSFLLNIPYKIFYDGWDFPSSCLAEHPLFKTIPRITSAICNYPCARFLKFHFLSSTFLSSKVSMDFCFQVFSAEMQRVYIEQSEGVPEEMPKKRNDSVVNSYKRSWGCAKNWGQAPEGILPRSELYPCFAKSGWNYTASLS